MALEGINGAGGVKGQGGGRPLAYEFLDSQSDPRQSVAIARAAMWADKVVFLDEPTAALGVVQTARVLDLVRQVRDAGIAVVLISHNMPQVLEVADRIEVMRLGRKVADLDAKAADVDALLRAMTGGIPGEARA